MFLLIHGGLFMKASQRLWSEVPGWRCCIEAHKLSINALCPGRAQI